MKYLSLFLALVLPAHAYTYAGTDGQNLSGHESNFLTALGGTAAGQSLFLAADAAAQRAAIGSPATGDIPTWDTLTGKPSTFAPSTHTHAASDITSGVLGVGYGGTGNNSYTIGNLLYASGTTTLSKLPGNITTTPKFLTTTGNGSVTNAIGYQTLQATDLPSTITSNTSGNAATVTTNANLTGLVTSTGNATAIADAALTIAKTSGLQTALDGKQSAITFGTGVQTALVVNTGSMGGFSTINSPATLTNKTINGASNTLTVRLANDVSGTLPLINGGTSTATAPTTGQVLTATDSTHATWQTPASGSTYTGTANQVIVTGTVLSTPQNIGTSSSPTFSSGTLTGALNLTGTAGASFLDSSYQSSAPSTPSASHSRFYFDTTGRPSWVKPDGFTRTFDGASIASNVVWTMPTTTATIARTDAAQSFSGIQSFSGLSDTVPTLQFTGTSVTSGIGGNAAGSRFGIFWGGVLCIQVNAGGAELRDVSGGTILSGRNLSGNWTIAGSFSGALTTDSSSSTTGSFITAGGAGVAKKLYVGDKIVAGAAITLKGYTVATLPTGATGDTAYVTDALAPTFLVAITGGGAVVTPVFYNGSAWVAH